MQSKKFDGVVIHFAETDAEWSALVLAKNDYRCVLCCNRATPAHIFSRRYVKTRLVIENGVPLCVIHHNLYDMLSMEKQEEMAIILIGRVLYDLLFKMRDEKEDAKIWK